MKVRQLISDKSQSILKTAHQAAIPYETLRCQLQGEDDFTISQLGRLADALDVHPAELLPNEFAQERAA